MSRRKHKLVVYFHAQLLSLLSIPTHSFDFNFDSLEMDSKTKMYINEDKH